MGFEKKVEVVPRKRCKTANPCKLVKTTSMDIEEKKVKVKKWKLMCKRLLQVKRNVALL